MISEINLQTPGTTEEMSVQVAALASCSPGMTDLARWCGEQVAGSLPLNPMTRQALEDLQIWATGGGALLEQVATRYTAEQSA